MAQKAVRKRTRSAKGKAKLKKDWLISCPGVRPQAVHMSGMRSGTQKGSSKSKPVKEQPVITRSLGRDGIPTQNHQ